MQVQQRVSDRLAIVVLNFRQWTGETVLNKEDFQLGQGGRLPPDQVAHLGSKRICNPNDLRVFAAIKQRAVRLLDACGVPFLGGWAVPLEKSKEVVMGLNNLVREYEQAKAVFLKHYDQAVRDWVAQNPEFGDELLRSLKTKSHVEARIKAGFSVFKVKALEGDTESFDVAEAGLGETLLAEVAKTARELYRRSYAGKTEITGRGVSPIRAMRDRLAGLAFVDNAILPVVNAIDTALRTLPKSGPYKGGDFYQLNSIVLVLCSEDRMRDLSQAVVEQANQDPEAFDLVATAPVADPVAENVVQEAQTPEPSSEPIEDQKTSEALPSHEDEPEDLSLDLDESLEDELDAFLTAKEKPSEPKAETVQSESVESEEGIDEPEEQEVEQVDEFEEDEEFESLDEDDESYTLDEDDEAIPPVPSMTQTSNNASSMFW